MVVFATPERAATPSTVSPGTPASASSSRVASRIAVSVARLDTTRSVASVLSSRRNATSRSATTWGRFDEHDDDLEVMPGRGCDQAHPDEPLDRAPHQAFPRRGRDRLGGA